MRTEDERAELLDEVLRSNVAVRPERHELALVDALEEVIGWIADPRPFHKGHHRHAWVSAGRDLTASLKGVGPSVAALAEPMLRQFDMQRAAERASQGQDRTADHRVVATAREVILSERGVLAAWSDVVEESACGDIRSVRVRELELARIMNSRGSEVDERWRTSAAVIADRAIGVSRARFVVGDHPQEQSFELDGLHEAAGLSFEQRVGLIGDYLATADPLADYVVWLAIDRASLSGFVIDLGSVVLYDSRWIGDVARNSDGERHPQIPSEVFADDWGLSWIPEGEFIVLARVEMGRRTGSFVERDARQQLLAVLAPVDRAYPGDWNVMPGHVRYRNGRWAGSSAFEDVAETPNHRRLEAAADEWLATDAAAVAQSLSSDSSKAVRRLLELYELDVAHRSADPLSTLLLAVRTIETISMSLMSGTNWSTLLDQYCGHIAWSEMKAELIDIAWHTLYTYEANPIEERRQRLREIFLEITSHGGSDFTIDLARFVARIPELCALWDGDGRHRSDPVVARRLVRVNELQRLHTLWTDSAAFSKQFDEVLAGLKLQMGRLVRLRNAAQHGGPLADTSIVLAARLADRCRRQLLGDVLGRLLAGDAPGRVRTMLTKVDNVRQLVLANTGSPMTALGVVATGL